MNVTIDVTACIKAIMAGLAAIAFFRYVIGEK